MKTKRRLTSFVIGVMLLAMLSGCKSKEDDTKETVGETKKVTILVAAASSLSYCMEDEIKAQFEKEHKDIEVSFTFDASGKLQQQIKEGADVDVFLSASMKNMTELQEDNLVKEDSIIELLENKVVLIVPQDSKADMKGFEDIEKAEHVALGDPASVPAGQYAKEVLTSLGLWDEIEKKESYGTNVTEVLNWVAEGSADTGVVYATDAKTNDKVKVVAEAPEGSTTKIIYPVGLVSASQKEEASQEFMDYLKTEEAMQIFESYGFIENNTQE